ncbi:MAG: T9SS type A sorting domain-containing protein, partial [Melioribacter sp.]|nr:T9SS type A sorting domain-containing protein [Melioribacter sp.]
LKGAMASLGIATAVEKEEAIPTQYVMYQNYPNPFNPTTNIKFALPNSGHVKLTIYDALGREVETLVNNELVAGTHTIEWTARNMASGVYLYRIEADNFVKVNKMLLVK